MKQEPVPPFHTSIIYIQRLTFTCLGIYKTYKRAMFIWTHDLIRINLVLSLVALHLERGFGTTYLVHQIQECHHHCNY